MPNKAIQITVQQGYSGCCNVVAQLGYIFTQYSNSQHILCCASCSNKSHLALRGLGSFQFSLYTQLVYSEFMYMVQVPLAPITSGISYSYSLFHDSIKKMQFIAFLAPANVPPSIISNNSLTHIQDLALSVIHTFQQHEFPKWVHERLDKVLWAHYTCGLLYVIYCVSYL
ncbi:hypothetical protein E2320_017719 [Naja naja]|nr:hypothetical protein E2320_017719 [Naja naja]